MLHCRCTPQPNGPYGLCRALSALLMVDAVGDAHDSGMLRLLGITPRVILGAKELGRITFLCCPRGLPTAEKVTIGPF